MFIWYVCFLCVIYHFFLTNFESVIYYNFCHDFWYAVKELHKVLFRILIYISIGKFTIHIKSKQRTPDSRSMECYKKHLEISWSSFIPTTSRRGGRIVSVGTIIFCCSCFFQYQLVFSFIDQRYCALDTNSPAEITLP